MLAALTARMTALVADGAMGIFLIFRYFENNCPWFMRVEPLVEQRSKFILRSLRSDPLRPDRGRLRELCAWGVLGRLQEPTVLPPGEGCLWRLLRPVCRRVKLT